MIVDFGHPCVIALIASVTFRLRFVCGYLQVLLVQLVILVCNWKLLR